MYFKVHMRFGLRGTCRGTLGNVVSIGNPYGKGGSNIGEPTRGVPFAKLRVM